MLFRRGVILFAIVNGKLPYSEDKLKEVTESMRFQRLKFRKHALPSKCVTQQLFTIWYVYYCPQERLQGNVLRD